VTTREIIAAAENVACVCGATPGQVCSCGHGVHYARLARARRAGFLSRGEFASVIADADVFTGGSVLLDPGAPR
jgi:hypothetical protein